ncbi:hypothetical protein M378DRAFT_157910, partial [Amanita muscaria Koide BX008]
TADHAGIPRPPMPPQEPDGMDPSVPNSGDNLPLIQGLRSPDVSDDEFDEPDDGNPPPPFVNLYVVCLM